LALGAAQQNGGTLSGSFSPIAAGSNVNLTVIGKLDWVQWGLYTDTSVNRKGSVSPAISGFTLLGDASCPTCSLAEYQYNDNWNGYTWYDGLPGGSVTNTTTGVWAYNYPSPSGSGFQFTAPADTSPKTLQVFVGAYAAQGQLRASLSDGSAPDFTSQPNSTVNNQGSGPGGVFTLNYSAGSPGQLLTVTWTVGSPKGSGANVTLQAAALTASGADNPPYVVITSPLNHATFLEPATIPIGISAQDFDGTVTNVALYAGTNKVGQSTAAPYSLTWPNVPRGRYTLKAAATDNAGVTSWSQPVEISVYGSGGSQSGVMGDSPGWVDLTTEGTADWAYWGLETETSFDTKDLVPRRISNFTVLGTNSVQRFDGATTAFSWSDGTPIASADSASSGVLITGITNGFQLTAPADTSPRQLNVYMGGYGVQGEFQAYLSDLSGRPYSDSSISNVYDSSSVLYTINYAAASAGQQLIVIYRSVDLFDLEYGNVSLQAATLQGGESGPLPVSILNPAKTGTDFVLSFATDINRTYVVQYASSLPASNWATLTTIAGNGGIVNATDYNVPSGQRFYRVQTQ